MRKFFELIERNVFLSQITGILKKERVKKHPPLITISRQYGSGGSVIAEKVAEKLGKKWKVYHGEIVDEIAEKTHLEKKLIKEVDEGNISFVEKIVDDFFGKRYLNLTSYHKELVRILSVIGNRGQAIIVGRGANFLFPDALRLRIISPLEERVKVIVKYVKVNKKKALQMIKDKDHKRSEFIRAISHSDDNSPQHYDLVIQTGKNFGVDEAVGIIYSLAKRKFKL